MEVSYELLWKICSGFLLSFLVYGLISLILYCSNSTHHDGSEQKMVKICINGGKKKKKRVKFVDQVDEDGFVKDIEVDGVNFFVGVEESGGKDEIFRGENGDGGVGLVDLSKKGEIFVGFARCVDVDVCLGSYVVDDQRDRNSTNSSVELASGENEVDKIVGCDVGVSLSSDELVGDHREQNSTNSSNEYEDEVTNNVNELDKRENRDNKIVDDQTRKEEAKARSNVGSKERSSGVFDEEEEWEGIETSDLAKEFGRAKCFVENGGKERLLVMSRGNDLGIGLYGLEKVAMEGPCHEPQPMAFKFAARAKWNAWRKLGKMSPEEAMEKYISVLSQNVPDWMELHSSEVRKSHSVEEKVDSFTNAQISTWLVDQRL